MKRRCHKRPNAAGHDHETNLADRGVGENLFNIALRQRDNRRKQSRHRTDNRNDGHRHWREDNQRT